MQRGGFSYENYILMLPTWAQWFNIMEYYVSAHAVFLCVF